MNWKNEWRKLRRFLAFALLTETGLMALVALGVRSMGEWSWHIFGVGLGIGGAAALVLAMYSLIGGGQSFKTLTRALKKAETDSVQPESPDYTFLLVMIFAGSVAIGAGQWVLKTF